VSKISSLTELANFVAKSDKGNSGARPKIHKSFWQAYKTATSSSDKRSQPATVSHMLSAVMAISARTRRIVSPKTFIELDVFTPAGRRAVHLIMGRYS